MRKITALSLCLVLCLGMAGCSAHHDHTWSYDAKNHWCDCECGKQIEPLPHNLYENICIACGVKVLDFGDTKYVEAYDDHGSIKTSAEYDTYGTLIHEMQYEWEYDHNGNPMRRLAYANGTLSEEVTYQPCLRTDVEVCKKDSIDYFEEGCRKMWLYDEYGYPLSGTTYLSDGSVSTQDTYENTYDDQGNLLKRVCFIDGVRTWETRSILGPDGNLYDSATISYKADGSIAFDRIYDYKFDDQGNLCYRSQSSGGVIVGELFFEVGADGRIHTALGIAYREDGTKSDEYIYDDRGNQIQHIEYHEDGSIKE